MTKQEKLLKVMARLYENNQKIIENESAPEKLKIQLIGENDSLRMIQWMFEDEKYLDNFCFILGVKDDDSL